MRGPRPLPFEFVAGHPALDFTNTVSWASRGLSQDRLVSYLRLLEWAEGARLALDTRSLRRRGKAEPQAALRAMSDARAVRAELHDLFQARARRVPVPAALIGRFNRRLAASLRRLEIRAEGAPGRLAWRLRERWNLSNPVLRVLWEAAALLASNRSIKQCANPNCGWLFIDTSRRGNRRWCDMAVCGSRHKAKAYYRRQKASSKGSP